VNQPCVILDRCWFFLWVSLGNKVGSKSLSYMAALRL
jgi:hypothetical protein